MPSLVDAWKDALPEMRNGVTGRAIWAALNAAVPVAIEGGQLVVGLAFKDRELTGHLGSPAVRRVVEAEIGRRMETNLTLRVIDGTTAADWESAKRKEHETDRLREEQRAKARAELTAKSTWDGVYEQLSRSYASIANKALPQNRARFLSEAIVIVAQGRKEIEDRDELTERNFSRCLERVAQYSELPVSMVALLVMQRSGEL